MQHKPLVLLALILLTISLFVFSVPVHGQVSVYHKTVSPAYVPIRIVISFAFSTNFTQPAVSTTNQSAWTFNTTSNPPANSMISFSTGALDVFQFGFTVYYQFPINQTVTVEVFQGSQQVEGIDQIPVSGNSFSMTFTVVTSVEPRVPTAEDILNILTGHFPTSSQYILWTELQSNAVADLENQIHMMWIMIFGGLGIALTVYLVPKLRKENK